MDSSRDEINWAPRLKRDLLRRLYELDAQGIVDEEMIDEVGHTLYQRCLSILEVDEARQGKVRCPRCARLGRETVLIRKPGLNEWMRCACGWEITWLDYMRTFKRRQLNIGGAGPAFHEYVDRFLKARSPQEKMLLIDRLIHEFHYSLASDRTRPTRAVCVNLINGNLTDVMALLEELASGLGSPPERLAQRVTWRENAQKTYWAGDESV